MPSSEGVVGVIPNPNNISFRIHKGLSDSGSGSTSGIINAVTDCVAAGANVISMSLGGGGHSSAFDAALNNAYDMGVLSVCAAGNSDNANVHYPAGYQACMSVASHTSTGVKSDFSSFGPWTEIIAPGR